MQLKTKVGIALVVLGASILGAWGWWTKTRNLQPVNLPMPLVAGQRVSSEFQLNFDGLYLIAIEADKTVPSEELHCLMGLDRDAQRCKAMPSGIDTTWVLSNGGRDIAHGSSREQLSSNLPTNGLARVIGEFQGKAGRAYQLQVMLAKGAEPLAPAHPRLRVGVASIAYTDLQSARMLVFSTAFICELFGAVLLLVAATRALSYRNTEKKGIVV